MQDDEVSQREPKIGTTKGEDVYIGKGSWISIISYENLLRERESSKFISGLSRSLWGIQPLSERCVRKQINTQAIELTPKKKAAVAGFFEMWMRDKRKYPEHLIGEELKKLNKYLNGAITSARSALVPKKRKSLNINTTQLHSNNDSVNEFQLSKEKNLEDNANKNERTYNDKRSKIFTLSTINQENKIMNNGSKEDLYCDIKNEKLKLKDLETDFMEKTDIDTDSSIVESEGESTRSVKTN